MKKSSIFAALLLCLISSSSYASKFASTEFKCYLRATTSESHPMILNQNFKKWVSCEGGYQFRLIPEYSETRTQNYLIKIERTSKDPRGYGRVYLELSCLGTIDHATLDYVTVMRKPHTLPDGRAYNSEDYIFGNIADENAPSCRLKDFQPYLMEDAVQNSGVRLEIQKKK